MVEQKIGRFFGGETMRISWNQLLIIDILYVVQFVLFIQWYYPKTIRITGCSPNGFPIEHLIAILEMIICFGITIFQVKKASKE